MEILPRTGFGNHRRYYPANPAAYCDAPNYPRGDSGCDILQGIGGGDELLIDHDFFLKVLHFNKVFSTPETANICSALSSYFANSLKIRHNERRPINSELHYGANI